MSPSNMSDESVTDAKMLNWASKATLVLLVLVLWQGASGIANFGYSIGDMNLGSGHGHSGELAFLVSIAITVMVVRSKTDSSQLKGMAFGLPVMFLVQIGLGYMMSSMTWSGMLHVMLALGIMSHATILWYHLKSVAPK